MITGSIAGLVNCLLVTPVELVKCRLQVQKENRLTAYYKGISDCIYKTYKSEGIKGIYKGNFSSIMREIPAYSGIYNIIPL